MNKIWVLLGLLCSSACFLKAMNKRDQAFEQELGFMGDSAKRAEGYIKQIASGSLTCDEEIAQFLLQDALLDRLLREHTYFYLFSMHEAVGKNFAKCLQNELDIRLSENVCEKLSPRNVIVLALLAAMHRSKRKVAYPDYLVPVIKELDNFEEVRYLIPQIYRQKQKGKAGHGHYHAGGSQQSGTGGSGIKNPLMPWATQ